MIVVFADLAIGIMMFILFLYLRSMQYITRNEIEESVVTAQEFAVQIWGLPEHDNIREFKAELWEFIENVQ